MAPDATEATQLALISQKLDSLNDYLRQQIADHEERIRSLERNLGTTNTNMAALAERLTVWQFVQGAYSSVAGIVAGVIGRLP